MNIRAETRERQPSATSRRSQTAIAVAGLIFLEILFVILYRFGNLEAHVIETIATGLGAGVVYFVILYAIEHLPDRQATLWVILLGAVLFRLTLLPLVPSLSSDPYRYHWDGQIQLAGYNPYLVKPDTLMIGAHETPLGHPLSAHDMPNIYPPLAELVFRAAARLPGNVAFKLPFFLADLLTVFLLAGCLRSSPQRNFRLAIYAWNPLVVVEFAGTGHSDSLALAALVAALLIIRSRIGVSTILLAAGALLKVFPVLLFPVWLRRAGWPRSGVAWAAVCASAALAGLCFWPYRAAWTQIPSTMAYFGAHFQNNNASLFSVLKAFSGSAEWASGIGVGIVVALALWAAARRLEPERAAYLVFGAVLLLSPNAYSWYFTWIIPFLCFFPNPAWLLLTILQFLSYHTLIRYGILGDWRWSPLMISLTYVAFYAWILWQTIQSKGTSLRKYAEFAEQGEAAR